MGRTGKAPAKVPDAMLRAKGVEVPEEEKADIDEILAGMVLEGGLRINNLSQRSRSRGRNGRENSKAIYVYQEVLNATTGREVIFCHECEAEWWKDESGLDCPACGGKATEIVSVAHAPHTDMVFG